MDDLEREIADHAAEYETALRATGLNPEVFYDEDGDEGWHITIGAGHEHPMQGGGTSREITVSYWTRDETWYWDRVDADGDRSGPWPCRADSELCPGLREAEKVVAFVRRNIICPSSVCDNPDEDSDR